MEQSFGYTKSLNLWNCIRYFGCNPRLTEDVLTSIVPSSVKEAKRSAYRHCDDYSFKNVFHVSDKCSK